MELQVKLWWRLAGLHQVLVYLDMGFTGRECVRKHSNSLQHDK